MEIYVEFYSDEQLVAAGWFNFDEGIWIDFEALNGSNKELDDLLNDDLVTMLTLDQDGFPIKEFNPNEDVYEIQDFYDMLNDEESFAAWCDLTMSSYTGIPCYKDFEDEFYGMYEDAEEFAREYVDNIGTLDDMFEGYFDYEAFGEDLLTFYSWTYYDHKLYVFM